MSTTKKYGQPIAGLQHCHPSENHPKITGNIKTTMIKNLIFAIVKGLVWE